MIDRDDAPSEECGVFALVAPGRDVSRIGYFALHALQHRGQESAGLAVSDGIGVTVQRDLGLVSSVFDEPALRSLQGDMAIGHVRYSTTGANRWENAQPLARPRGDGIVTLGHNGNLTNSDELRREVEARGAVLMATTDTEVIAALLAERPGSLLDAVCAVMPRLRGAFSAVAMSEDELVVFRDAHGVRPLVLGRFENGWCAASETCALDQIGAVAEREVRPGEAVRLTAAGIESRQALAPAPTRRLCIFEQIYFARPDSYLDGGLVWEARQAMGRELAAESPVAADCVMGLPDSGTPAAIGYAAACGLPYIEGVVRNRYVGRSFIQPDQALRQRGVRLKFNPLPGVIRGRRVVVVDDSIVRGTTIGQVVDMLRGAGAAEIHLRISSPPIKWPCFYGIDMADRSQLIAANHSIAEIAREAGADSLAYLSLEGLDRAIGAPDAGHCRACLTGDYPIPIGPEAAATGDKLRFEVAFEPVAPRG